MEKFKMRIKRRILLLSGMIVAALALGAYVFFVMDNAEQASMAYRTITGFQLGIIIGIGGLALIQIIKLSKGVMNETNLKRLYNQENDERLKTIRSKAGMPMLMVTSITMLIAAVIIGYFNIVVFYTLLITTTVQLLIGGMVKLYCMKTM